MEWSDLQLPEVDASPQVTKRVQNRVREQELYHGFFEYKALSGERVAGTDGNSHIIGKKDAVYQWTKQVWVLFRQPPPTAPLSLNSRVKVQEYLRITPPRHRKKSEPPAVQPELPVSPEPPSPQPSFPAQPSEPAFDLDEVVSIASDEFAYSTDAHSEGCSVSPRVGDVDFINDSDDQLWDDSDAEEDDMAILDAQMAFIKGIDGAVSLANSKLDCGVEVDSIGEAEEFSVTGARNTEKALQAADASLLAEHTEVTLQRLRSQPAPLMLQSSEQLTPERRVSIAMQAVQELDHAKVLKLHSQHPTMHVLYEVCEPRIDGEKKGTIPVPSKFDSPPPAATPTLWVASRDISMNAAKRRLIPTCQLVSELQSAHQTPASPSGNLLPAPGLVDPIETGVVIEEVVSDGH